VVSDAAERTVTAMLKKLLLSAMAVVFCLFLVILLCGYGEIIAGLNLSIVTAVILIGLFVTFILVSEWERRRRDHRP